MLRLHFKAVAETLRHFLLLSYSENFKNIPGLVFTTLSTNRPSAFRLWNSYYDFGCLTSLCWASESFRPILTEGGWSYGRVSHYCRLFLLLYLRRPRIFFLIAAVDLANQSRLLKCATESECQDVRWT